MDEQKLVAIIDRARNAQPPTPPRKRPNWAPCKVKGTLEERFARVPIPPAKTAEEMRQHEAEQARQAEEARVQHRREQFLELVYSRGARYRDCTLATFKATTDSQGKVKAALMKYAEDLPSHVAEGHGLLMIGSSGTGKDHLLVGMARVGILKHGLRVTWRNAIDLFATFRDTMTSKDEEGAIVKKLTWPDILILSDLVPPLGNLTPYQSSVLFSIIDARYNEGKATWGTVNVADAKEAAGRLGASIVDRLKENALVCRCSWPSYRGTMEVVG